MNPVRKPILSVCIFTYNQAPYIADCLEGVLSQETDFDFEIVIGEDCSDDGTLQICESYAADNPGRIKLIKRPKNIGSFANSMHTLHACRGEFIALCEGDDFWTYKGKVQQQVQFLRTHPDYNLAFHDAGIINMHHVDNQIQKFSEYEFVGVDEKKKDYSLYDLLKGTLCPTASVVFRRPHEFKFPEWYTSLPFGDMSLFILVNWDAKVRYFNETWSVYRIHQASASSQPNMAKIYHLGKIRMYLRLYDTLPLKYKNLLPNILRTYTKSVSDIRSLLKEDRVKLFEIMPIYCSFFLIKSIKRRLFNKFKKVPNTIIS